jgi:hypothetical protein
MTVAHLVRGKGPVLNLFLAALGGHFLDVSFEGAIFGRQVGYHVTAAQEAADNG